MVNSDIALKRKVSKDEALSHRLIGFRAGDWRCCSGVVVFLVEVIWKRLRERGLREPSFLCP